jgi:nicotinamide-nucleotide amidase
MRLVVGAGVVYLMPGVPHEMEAMFAESVLPDLLTRAGEPAVIVNRVLRTAGMWESAVAAALGPLVERLAEQGNPTIAFLASAGQTRVRITAKAATYDDALAMVAPVEQEARAALGSGVYGTDDDTLDAVVIGLLRSRGETVAVAESLTGGLLGGLLTAGRGASDGFAGGVIAYSNDAKAALLGVGDDLLAAEGAVSAAVAAAMAAGVRARLRTTYGVALTGVAGPDGQDGQPVGTVFAGLATPDGVDTTQLRLPGDRARIRQYAAVAAVNLLRLHLVGAPAR